MDGNSSKSGDQGSFFIQWHILKKQINFLGFEVSWAFCF